MEGSEEGTFKVLLIIFKENTSLFMKWIESIEELAVLGVGHSFSTSF